MQFAIENLHVDKFIYMIEVIHMQIYIGSCNTDYIFVYYTRIYVYRCITEIIGNIELRQYFTSILH